VKQLFRLTGILWLLLLFTLLGARGLGELWKVPLIAFLSERDRTQDLFLGDSESTLTIRITNDRTREDTLDWSPDGRYLAFDSWATPDDKIWLLDTADWALEEISLGEFSYVFWYSPNKLILGINRTGEEHLVDVETFATSPYTEASPCEGCSLFTIQDRMTAYDLELSIINGDLQVQIDTNAYISTAFEPNTDLQPWSPNGQSFLFITGLQGQPDLYLSAAEGGIARRLTNTPSPEQMPRWSSDGQRISYVSYEDGNPEIYVMELATGYHYNLSRHANRDYNPVWQPVP
jgi:Tol biopolymer transport system component